MDEESKITIGGNVVRFYSEPTARWFEIWDKDWWNRASRVIISDSVFVDNNVKITNATLSGKITLPARSCKLNGTISMGVNSR